MVFPWISWFLNGGKTREDKAFEKIVQEGKPLPKPESTESAPSDRNEPWVDAWGNFLPERDSEGRIIRMPLTWKEKTLESDSKTWRFFKMRKDEEDQETE